MGGSIRGKTGHREGLRSLLLGCWAFLIFLTAVSAQAYFKPVKTTNETQQVEELLFLQLTHKKGDIWVLTPQNIFMPRFVLVPQNNYTPPLYSISLSYPLKGMLYQSFLEMNLRYLLADQIRSLLDYREQLAKLKDFQKTAKELLGPYWQQIEEESKGQANPRWKDFLPVVDIGSLFSSLTSSAGPKISGPGLIYSSSKTMPSFGRYHSPKPKGEYQQEDKSTEGTPSLLREAVKAFFDLINWLGENKEILLGLYLLVIFFAFLVSNIKR